MRHDEFVKRGMNSLHILLYNVMLKGGNATPNVTMELRKDYSRYSLHN